MAKPLILLKDTTAYELKSTFDLATPVSPQKYRK